MAVKDFTIKTHNGTSWDEKHPKTNMGQVVGLNGKMSEVEAIAKGASRAYVFDTSADFDAWLAVAANKSELKAGDNLYIRDTAAPDYWWDGTEKQQLSSETVMVTNATTSADGLMSKNDKSKLDGIATGATKVTTPSDIGAATAAQGAKADTALQSVSLATTSADGLMSKDDKSRIDSIPVIMVGTSVPANLKVGDMWFDENNN